MLGVVASAYVATAPSTTLTDNWADAVVMDLTLAPHTIVQGNNTGYGLESGEPTAVGGFTTTKTAWAKFTSPVTGKISFGVTTQGGITDPFDALIAVYTGSAVNALTLVAGSDPEEVSFSATAGTVYSIQVGGFSGANGAFDLHVTTNEDVACAWVIPAGTSGTMGPFYEPKMTFESGEPTPSGYSGGTVWYRKTIGGSGGAAQFDLIGSSALTGGHDNVIGVYTSSDPNAPTYANLTLVVADDQSGGNNDAKANFTASSSTVYFIQVMPMYNGTASAYKLNYSVPS